MFDGADGATRATIKTPMERMINARHGKMEHHRKSFRSELHRDVRCPQGSPKSANENASRDVDSDVRQRSLRRHEQRLEPRKETTSISVATAGMVLAATLGI